MRTSLEDFIERAKAVHGSLYDYSKVVYSTTEKEVVIVCPIHGDFFMRPRAHYQNRCGCPSCDTGAKSGFSVKSKWATDRIKRFYIIEAFGDGEKFIKFGLTTEEIVKRFQKGQFPYDYNLLFEFKIKGGLNDEDRFLTKYKRLRYYPKRKFRGDTECVEYGLRSHIIADAKMYFQK